MKNVKSFQYILAIGVVILPIILFAETSPFGDPASPQTFNIKTIPTGGPIKTATSVSSGGTINTGASTTAGGQIQTGTSTTAGGKIQTGGSVTGGGSVMSGGGIRSGNLIRTVYYIFSGGTIPRAGGSIESGGSIATGGGCIEYAKKTVIDYDTVESWDDETGQPYFKVIGQHQENDTTRCLKFASDVLGPTNPFIQSGGAISTVNDSNRSAFSFFGSPFVETPKTFKEFISLLIDLIRIVIPLTVVMSLWFFFWGLTRFIRNSGDENKEQEGKDLMIWGTLALFVMVSVYGLLNLLYASAFGGSISGLPLLPQ